MSKITILTLSSLLSLPLLPACNQPTAPSIETPQKSETPRALPAANVDAAKTAEDFLHSARINNIQSANESGKKLLAANLNPQILFAAFNTASNGRDFRAVVDAAAHRPELSEVAAPLLEKLDQGLNANLHDRTFLLAEIERLNLGVRGYRLAKERLTAAGPTALPVLIEVLHDPKKQELHPDILRVMAEISQ